MEQMQAQMKQFCKNVGLQTVRNTSKRGQKQQNL